MCTVEECSTKAYCKGYCQSHYRRWKKWGNPLLGKPWFRYPKDATCEVADCNSLIKAKNLCSKHHTRLMRHGSVSLTKKVFKYENQDMCSVKPKESSRCRNVKYAKDMCKKHYNSFHRHGDPLASFTKELSPKSYVLVQSHGHPNGNANGRIVEHRLIMSTHLGRPLLKHENVHHINGNRHDNRLENLELWSTWQPAGQRIHDKINWAVELLQLYAPDKLKETECQIDHKN